MERSFAEQAWPSCRAPALQFLHRTLPRKTTVATTRGRHNGVLLLFAPAKLSMSHWLCGFTLPSAAMEVTCSIPLFRSQATMFLSARANKSPLEKRLLAMEKSNLHTFHSAHKPPITQRIPFARAESEYGRSRASSSMPETTPGRRKTNHGSIFGDVDESENVSVWDSNAEGIRRSWRTNRTSSAGSRSPEDRSDGYASNTENSWQWWRNGPDDDDYEDDTDDEEDEETIFSWFNLDNFDMLSAISMLRWLLPAAAVFLPWLFGGPMFLMMAFAAFPLVQKLLGFFVPSAWKVALQGRNTRSRQKQGKTSRPSNRRTGASSDFWTRTNDNPFADDIEEPDFINSNNEDWESSFLRESINRGSASKFGGWDEEDDNLSVQKNVTRRKKKGALQRRQSRKEVPLFFRLLVALFPFLRSWGGFL